jgi:ribokinase
LPGEPAELDGSRRRSGRVVVVGSLNLDSVHRVARLPGAGETILAHGHEARPGGKGANQAYAAARAGAAVVMVGACGDDDAGATSRASLRAAGVDTSEIVRASGHPTGSAIVVVADDGENLIVVDQGANRVLDAGTTAAALARLDLDAADVVLVSFEIPETAVLAAVAAATDRGSAVVVNPAPVRPLDPRVLRPDVVLTPNASEARVLAGAADVAEAARRLAGLTGGAVVVTCGADGSLLQSGKGLLRVPALAVTAADTTGAGDVFSGVLAAGLSEAMPLVEAAVRATAAASLSVRVAGARGGVPDRDAIDEALQGRREPDRYCPT